MALIRPTSFWRQVSPRGAIADLVTVFRQAGTNRWRIAVASATITVGIFSVIAQEGGEGPPIAPRITYITTWAPHRTEAEIVASNITNQVRKEQLAAEQAASDERIRQMYKSLGRMSGMDVEAIEKKAMAEKAAENARNAANTNAQIIPAENSAPPASAPQKND